MTDGVRRDDEVRETVLVAAGTGIVAAGTVAVAAASNYGVTRVRKPGYYWQ